MNHHSFLKQFGTIWSGGYYEGNPLDPMSLSSYGMYGFNSILYTTYLVCIKPYVGPDTTVIEIGPGRGAWTRCFLERDCRKVVAIDAAPPEHTKFYEYVGRDERVTYRTVTDFSLDEVEDESGDYFFSFGVFCHLTPEMCSEYITNLYRKMRFGSRGFLMIADFEKYNRCVMARERTSLYRLFAQRKMTLPRLGLAISEAIKPGKYNFAPLAISARMAKADDAGRGGWYHLGLEPACAMLAGAGFAIVEKDVEVNARDPIIHFTKAG